MTNRIMAAAAIAAMSVLPAGAQISGDGGPIRVNADRSEVMETQRQVVLIDNVDIMQGEARLRANRVILNYAAAEGDTESSGLGNFGDISSMDAIGEVFYVTPDLKATGDKGRYVAADDTITMTGNVVLIRGEDVATGEKLVMQLSEGRTTLDGGAGQIQMNINPAQQEDEGADETPSN